MPALEPITTAFLRAHSRLSDTAEDELLTLYITAAREKAETYCNTYFTSQEVTQTFYANQSCPIPAADILNVSGFYSSAEEVANAYWYFNEYRKGIIINRELPIDYDNLPTYSVTYMVTVDPEKVPASVKVAIAKIAADLYENRENGGSEAVGISYKTLLAPYRVIV